jgi:hypothetical protein
MTAAWLRAMSGAPRYAASPQEISTVKEKPTGRRPSCTRGARSALNGIRTCVPKNARAHTHTHPPTHTHTHAHMHTHTHTHTHRRTHAHSYTHAHRARRLHWQSTTLLMASCSRTSTARSCIHAVSLDARGVLATHDVCARTQSLRTGVRARRRSFRWRKVLRRPSFQPQRPRLRLPALAPSRLTRCACAQM